MQLLGIYKALLSDSFTLKNYKRMSKFAAVICAILLLPFIALYACVMALYGLALISKKIIDSPTDYLMSFVKDEGRDVKHATQAVIYLIGFPLIFALKALTCALIFVIFVTHFAASLIGYIATLGGMKFSPFLLDEADRKSEAATAGKYGKAGVIVFILIAISIVLEMCFLPPVLSAANEMYYTTAPERGCQSLVNRVTEQYEAGEMNDKLYQSFYSAYEAGDVTVENYETYEILIFGEASGYELEAYELYLTVEEKLTALQDLFAYTYSLFIIIFVLAFFRRSKSAADEGESIDANNGETAAAEDNSISAEVSEIAKVTEA